MNPLLNKKNMPWSNDVDHFVVMLGLALYTYNHIPAKNV